MLLSSSESGLDTNIVAEDTTRRGINDANGSTKRESRSPWRDQSRRDGPRRDNTARRDGPRGDGAPQGGAWRPGRPSARQGKFQVLFSADNSNPHIFHLEVAMEALTREVVVLH